MAFVFYASLSLWAILILILDIGTLVSVRVPEIPAGALPALTYYFYGYVSFGEAYACAFYWVGGAYC